jgi:hypothetical protein
LRTGHYGEYLTLRGRKSEGWRKLHNEELHNFHSSPNIIRVIKSRRMRNTYKILLEKPERKNHLEDLGIDGP